MALDLVSYSNAIARLEEGLVQYAQNPKLDIIRDGLIQRFEFTYEMAHKMLKRGLKAGSPSPEQFDTMVFADLVRAGNDTGLLRSEWATWKHFRDMRSKTSHTYDVNEALKVASGIPQFLQDAVFLRDQLAARGI